MSTVPNHASALTNWLTYADKLTCDYDYPDNWGEYQGFSWDDDQSKCEQCFADLTDAASSTYRYTGKTVTQTTGCTSSCFGMTLDEQPSNVCDGTCDQEDYRGQIRSGRRVGDGRACDNSDFEKVTGGWMAVAKPELLPLVRAFQVTFTSAEEASGRACACSPALYGLYEEMMNASTCQTICRADIQCAAYEWTLVGEPEADHGAMVLNYSSPINGTCKLYDYSCGSAPADPPSVPPPVDEMGYDYSYDYRDWYYSCDGDLPWYSCVDPAEWSSETLQHAVTCCEADGMPTAGDTCCQLGELCLELAAVLHESCCKYFGGTAPTSWQSECRCIGGYKVCKGDDWSPTDPEEYQWNWHLATPCLQASLSNPKCSGETCSGENDECDGDLVCGRYSNNPDDHMCCECSNGQCELDGVAWCKNHEGGECSGNDNNCQDGLVCGMSADSSSGYQCCNGPAVSNDDPNGVACYEAFTPDSSCFGYEDAGYSCNSDGWCARLGCEKDCETCAENKGKGLVVNNGRCVAVCEDLDSDARFTSIGLQYCVNATSETTFEHTSLEQCKAFCGSSCNAIMWGTDCKASDFTWSGGSKPIPYCDDIGDASCCVQKSPTTTSCSAAGLMDSGESICPNDKTCNEPSPICAKTDCKNYQSCAPSVIWRTDAANYTTYMKDLSSSITTQDNSSSCTFVQYELTILPAPPPPPQPPRSPPLVPPPPPPLSCTFVITATRTAGSILQLSELRLFEGPTQLTVATISAPDGDSPTNEEISNLVDGDTSTKWLDFRTSGSRKVIFTIAGAPFITRYQLYTANDYKERDPTSWALSCDDGTADSVSSFSPPDERFTSYGLGDISRRI